jgi:acid phosphatase
MTLLLHGCTPKVDPEGSKSQADSNPNRIQNGSFEAGVDPWFLNVQDGNAALALDSTTSSDGAYSARIDIAQASTQGSWMIQLQQMGIALAAGQDVTVSFSAMADAARSIDWSLQQNGDPWTVYAGTSVSLSTGWASYSLTFTPSASDPSAFFALNLADATGSVWIDNVVISGGATSTCTPTDCASQGASCGAIPDGCGGTLDCGSCTGPQTGGARPFGHVIVVVEENHDQANALAMMPYLSSLANQYGLAAQYYADTHPSIGNYEVVVTGQISTNDDNQTPSSLPISTDNVVRQLIAAGRTWKSYAEDLPSVGYLGDDYGSYVVRHNPFAYLTDVQNDPTQAQNLVPFSQFAADLAAGTLPDYSFIVPNICNDAHNCGLDTADAWLRANIDPLVRSPMFQKDGLLVVTFDESEDDNTNGGGLIATAVVSPLGKRGYSASTVYQHESLCRLTLEGLGVSSLPNGAAQAPAMWEFFTFAPPR